MIGDMTGQDANGLEGLPEAPDSILVTGENVWTIAVATRASLIIDAADYYHYIREMMEAAAQRILIIGWDFDSRISLEPHEGKHGETLGAFFLRLTRENPARRIDVLKWSFGALKQFLRPSAAWMLLRWYRTNGIDFRFDRSHPAGCSHHQKIVVIDESLAVCGGIDVSSARWDTPEHRDDDPRRLMPTRRWLGLLPPRKYPPWHDATMMMAGDVAARIGELARERWQAATGRRLDDGAALPDQPSDQPSDQAYDQAPRHWPQDLPVQFENVEIGISRTRAAYGDLPEIREIEALWIDMIAAAERFLYIENQYLTSGKVAAAIAERMAEENPPEIIVIMPRQADGWLEQKAMDGARVRLARAIGQTDTGNRFRVYVPVTAGGEDIYVHAKVAIMDDRLLRVGSANLNNRSMGLDSECDVVIDAGLAANAHTPRAIAALRDRLLGEHLGVAPDRIADELARRGSLIAVIEALRAEGKAGGGRTLELLELAKPGPFDQFIADNELLDPANADGFFEPLGRRSIWRSWRQGKSWTKLRQKARKLRRRKGSKQ